MHPAFTAIGCLSLAFGLSAVAAEAPLEDLALPAPRMAGGMPLMNALKARQSLRAWPRS